MPIRYVPPTPEGLLEQKRRRKATSMQMAQVYGLAGDNQWRKYTSGKEPRPMSLPMLFLAMALEHRGATVEEVFEICRRETGAVIDLDTAGELQP
jgi:hypothetical protein